MVRKGTNHFGGSGSGWGPNMDPCHIVESQKIDPYHIAFLTRVADPGGFYPDPTFEKKSFSDPTQKDSRVSRFVSDPKKPGFGSDPQKTRNSPKFYIKTFTFYFFLSIILIWSFTEWIEWFWIDFQIREQKKLKCPSEGNIIEQEQTVNRSETIEI